MTETSTYTHQELSARLAEVERQRDEAAAMVGRLLYIARESQDWDWLTAKDQAEDAESEVLFIKMMQDLVDQPNSITPPAALAEIRSEAAGRGYYDALVMCYERRFGYGTSEPYESDFEERAHEYTQQLRNGGE